MRSIYSKFIVVALAWLIAIAVAVGGVSIAIVVSITHNDSVLLLSQVCEKETLRFTNEFERVEASVKTVRDYIDTLMADAHSGAEFYSDSFCVKILTMTLNIANRTDGAMAVYFRYDPEKTGSGTKGFFWSRSNDSEQFSYFTPTDILAYDQNDTEHVGWFYQPKSLGQPLWMSPYYNKNLNVFMISYIIPVFTPDGDFLGVIGMDIDFNKIIQLTDNVELYETGRARLVDLSEYLVYSSDGNGGVCEDTLTNTLYNHITTLNPGSKTLEITDDAGVRYLSCYGMLSNGMRLLIYAPTVEINAQRNRLILLCVVVTALLLLLTALNLAAFTKRIVHPLRRITALTERYAHGDWSESYISGTGDEIQTLSESISVMAEMTRSYIDRINDSASRDSLTGLRNKNYYLAYIQRYMDRNRTERRRYGVVVMDINFLKRANDRYGHELGDRLIIRCGEIICSVFAHSPVFRIGGDEFVVLLENQDLEARDALAERFVAELAAQPPIEADVPVSVAFGIATAPEDADEYDALFRLADSRMYDYKRAMKGGRE